MGAITYTQSNGDRAQTVGGLRRTNEGGNLSMEASAACVLYDSCGTIVESVPARYALLHTPNHSFPHTIRLRGQITSKFSHM